MKSELSHVGNDRNYLEVPVLVLLYNRPQQTRALFERLREIGMKNIYVSSDAAGKDSENQLVEEVRQLLRRELNWGCNVTIMLRERNEGLRRSVVSGIDWFFQNVDEGIILEDDCLPGEDFFRFCADMLARYRNNSRIMHISGDNSAKVSVKQPWSYCFVRYPHIWGWATWKTSWDLYDRDLSLWNEFKSSEMVRFIFRNGFERRVWEPIYDRLRAAQEPDTWDWQWSATLAMHDGLAVQPLKNLVSNKGFGSNATHTKTPNRRADVSLEHLTLLRHPPVITRHLVADRQIFRNTHLDLVSNRGLRFTYKILRNLVHSG